MVRTRHAALAEPPADPFQERHRSASHERLQLMGGRFDFETDSPRLLSIVRLAYAGLPPHKFALAEPRFLVKLMLIPRERTAHARVMASEPPRVRPLAGGGILCGAMGGSNFAAIDPRYRSGLVVVSQDMLKFPYHIRYELLEFVVYVLASRVQGLVPLHAACVGRGGQGILLLGPSGSGKSTVSLHCLLRGLDFLAEDSVLVRPNGLVATGVANFLHVRPDSLRFLKGTGSAADIRQASVIRRRSGVEKFELDLRRAPYRLAPAPLRIGAVIFISPQGAGVRSLLRPIGPDRLIQRLAASQRYAASQPGWNAFIAKASRLRAFELRRGRHPIEAVEALEKLLPSGRTAEAGRREES